MARAAALDQDRIILSAWAGLAVLWLINALKNIDRVLMGVLAPAVKDEFQLTDAQVGLFALGFSVAYALFGLPFGRWADRSSRRLIIAGVTALWSLMTAACGMAVNYTMLLAGRIGIAVGEAGFLPAAITMVSDLFTPRMRNLALGLLFTGSAVGVFLGLALGGWLSAEFGWRVAFLALGLPGLAISLIAYLLLRDPERGKHDTLHYADAGELTVGQSFAALFRNRLYVWIMVTSACNAFAHLGTVHWMPSFFQRTHHLSTSTMGLSFGTAFALGMLLGHVVGGTLATRLAKTRVFAPLAICIWANFAIVPCFLLTLWLHYAWGALVMTMVSIFLAGLAHPAQATAEQNALAPRLRGIGHSTKAFLVALVTGIVPYGVGLLSDGLAPSVGTDSLRWALSISQVVLLIASFAAWRAYRLGRRADQAASVG